MASPLTPFTFHVSSHGLLNGLFEHPELLWHQRHFVKFQRCFMYKPIFSHPAGDISRSAGFVSRLWSKELAQDGVLSLAHPKIPVG